MKLEYTPLASLGSPQGGMPCLQRIGIAVAGELVATLEQRPHAYIPDDTDWFLTIGKRKPRRYMREWWAVLYLRDQLAKRHGGVEIDPNSSGFYDALSGGRMKAVADLMGSIQSAGLDSNQR
jgi:hypothetical protein